MLRKRYEQIRERALERTAIAFGSDVVMRRGMRSWMETGSRVILNFTAPSCS
jgi:hypothetical protein